MPGNKPGWMPLLSKQESEAEADVNYSTYDVYLGGDCLQEGEEDWRSGAISTLRCVVQFEWVSISCSTFFFLGI